MATLTGALAIGYQNLASGKTITATTSATGFPATNLSLPRLGSHWHSTTGSLTSQNVDVDLASSLSYDVVALLGTNLDDDGNRRMYGDDTSNTFPSPDWDPGAGSAFDISTPPLISGLTSRPPFGRHVIQFTVTTQTDRYVRVQLSDSGNPYNHLRASVYWVGPIEQFSFDYQWEPGPWKVYGIQGSQRIARVHNFTFKNLSAGQKIKLGSLYYTYKESGRMLVIPRPLVPASWISEAIYCTFGSEPRITRMITSDEKWVMQVQFVEVLD